MTREEFFKMSRKEALIYVITHYGLNEVNEVCMDVMRENSDGEPGAMPNVTPIYYVGKLFSDDEQFKGYLFDEVMFMLKPIR